ncbi:ERV/ALR sulfhydryl oxidase domain-containing protein [Scheffersomyces coipomensis]|uniref:ERV/ALR sulfhydryl oxidase domain-containing protein n=1 Tax=Scheffersomyces coipomensis TaxID=1788519 RepID=UPI00315CB05D
MMIKVIRKPLVATIALFFIICTVYFMTSSDGSIEKSLGSSSPMNMLKNSMPKFNNFGEYKGEAENETPKPPPISIQEEKIVNQEEESIADLTNDYGDSKKDEEKPDKYEEDDESSTGTKSKLGKISNNKASDIDDVTIVKTEKKEQISLSNEITETPFMPKMANETLKAQLGNAAWKLFHTILARYPDDPTKQERTTLSQYIQLFGQVYPCGDCARHFQKLLKKYPPQTKSRKTAALWGCDIHNKVNEKLGKDIYDCTTILEDYDCGCGADELEADITLGGESIDHLKKIKLDEVEADGQLGG